MDDEKNRTFILKKYKHLFFDLDGTLWDIYENTHNAISLLFQENQNTLNGIDKDFFIKRYYYHNDRLWTLYRQDKVEKETLRTLRFERAFEEVGITDKVFIEHFSNRFINTSPHQPITLKNAHQLLDYCKQHYELHIITNGFVEVQGFKLEAAKLTSYFTHIINSEHCGVRKPHPGIFEYALKKAEATKENSLMIGDDWDADIIGARDFGIDQAFITTTENMLNQLNEENGQKKLRHNYQATYTVSDLAELLKVL